MGFPRFDLLGDLLMNALKFAESGFDTTLIVVDSVRFEQKTPCSEMFERQDDRWFVRSDSLPGTLEVLAVAVDADSILIETAPLDNAAVVRILREQKCDVVYSAGQLMVGDTVVAEVADPVKPEELLVARCLWTIPWRQLGTMERLAAVLAADTCYSYGGFTETEAGKNEDNYNESAAPRKAELQMRMVLQQTLSMEQRPMLSLKQEMRPQQKAEQVMTMRTELGLLFSQQQQILKMSEEELEAWALRDQSTEGKRKALNTLHFVLAGQIRKALKVVNCRGERETLPWKEARLIAWQLINQGVGRGAGRKPKSAG